MKDTTLFVEETTPSGYNILWQDGNPQEAIAFLSSCPSKHRLELWSRAWAEAPQGFAPMAFRPADSNQVMISSMFKMIFLS